jgi:hypothetical protein
MKRALLLLVAALGLTGCTNHCDVSDLSIFWSFSGPASSGNLNCATAGVSQVRISIDNEDPPFDETVPCRVLDAAGQPQEGVLLTEFFRGVPYDFTLQGLDAQGAPLYIDQFTYVPNGYCGAERRDRVLTSNASDFSIAYAFQPPADCTTPTAQSPYRTTFIWFHLTDQDGRDYSVDARFDPQAIPCGAGNATVVIPKAAYGRYTLAGIEEVEILATNDVYVYHYNCNPVSFQHAAPGEVFSAPPMIQQAAQGTNRCPSVAHSP